MKYCGRWIKIVIKKQQNFIFDFRSINIYKILSDFDVMAIRENQTSLKYCLLDNKSWSIIHGLSVKNTADL